MPVIKQKRACEQPSRKEGERISVERSRPRGRKKRVAHVDLRLKEMAPGAAQRKCFAHDIENWAEFCKRYRSDLKQETEAIDLLTRKAMKPAVAFAYSARSHGHNGALLLKEFFEKTTH